MRCRDSLHGARSMRTLRCFFLFLLSCKAPGLPFNDFDLRSVVTSESFFILMIFY